MINLIKNEDCCGCTACASICPHHCISMKEDSEGFLYPFTNISTCIQCNACNKVCPVIKCKGDNKSNNYSTNSQAYAALNVNNDILLSSSSGGVFTSLASAILAEDGLVYGAAWINGVVQHTMINTYEDLDILRRSKYVQSSLNGILKQIKSNLILGKKVLFSGTPCQIAGLKYFLRREYNNLYTVEIACHGAPSPKVLRCYMKELQQRYGSDVQLNFRSKLDGWINYKVTAYNDSEHFFYESQKENIYMKGYLRELYSRPICYQCPFKTGKSGADITLADFWGVADILPDFPSHNGVSLVITHSIKGGNLFKGLSNLKIHEVDLNEAIRHNSSLVQSQRPHPERNYFFKHLDDTPYHILLERCVALRRITKLKLIINSYLNRIL